MPRSSSHPADRQHPDPVIQTRSPQRPSRPLKPPAALPLSDPTITRPSLSLPTTAYLYRLLAPPAPPAPTRKKRTRYSTTHTPRHGKVNRVHCRKAFGFPDARQETCGSAMIERDADAEEHAFEDREFGYRVHACLGYGGWRDKLCRVDTVGSPEGDVSGAW